MAISPPRLLLRKKLQKSEEQKKQQEENTNKHATGINSNSSYLFLQQSPKKRWGVQKSVTFDPTIGADFESSDATSQPLAIHETPSAIQSVTILESREEEEEYIAAHRQVGDVDVEAHNSTPNDTNSSEIQQLESELATLQQMCTEKMHLKTCLTAELNAKNETDRQVALVEKLIERQKQAKEQLDMEMNRVNRQLEMEMNQVHRQINLEVNQVDRKQELEALDLLAVAEATRETLTVPPVDIISGKDISHKDELDKTWTSFTACFSHELATGCCEC